MTPHMAWYEILAASLGAWVAASFALAFALGRIVAAAREHDGVGA